MRALGDAIAEDEREVNALAAEIYDFLIALPNLPDDDLKGGGKENNEVVKVVGQKPEFTFEPKITSISARRWGSSIIRAA